MHCNGARNATLIVVTMFGDDGNIIDSIAAGATGDLRKDALLEHIAACSLQVRAGGSPISPAIARRVLQRFRVDAKPRPGPVKSPRVDTAQHQALSARETEILRLVAKGLSFKEVGEVLSISSHTVITHVKRVYSKLAVHSRGEAVDEAGQLGLL